MTIQLSSISIPTQDTGWTATTDNMTLAAGGKYVIGSGHTVTFPTGAIGDAIYALPASGDWTTLGATLNAPGGWTIGAGQDPIPAVGDVATFVINSATNYMVAVGGATASSEPVLTVEQKGGSYTTTASDFGKYIRFTAGVPTLHAPVLADVGKMISVRNATGSAFTALAAGGVVFSGSAVCPATDSLVFLVTGANAYDVIGGA